MRITRTLAAVVSGLLLAFVIVPALPVGADTVQVSYTLAGTDPQGYRPYYENVPCQGAPQPPTYGGYYKTIQFFVDADGSYNFHDTHGSGDAFVGVYSGAYNSGASLAGCLGTFDESSSLGVPLQAYTTYTLLETEFGAGIAGTFSVDVTGPGAFHSGAFTSVSVAPATIPSGTVGAPYQQVITAVGGVGGPYTFAVISGALPAGIALGADGTLSGTPTAAGTFTFTVTATDSEENDGSIPYDLVVVVAEPDVVDPIVVEPTFTG